MTLGRLVDIVKPLTTRLGRLEQRIGALEARRDVFVRPADDSQPPVSAPEVRRVTGDDILRRDALNGDAGPAWRP
jgi:hypothetical protein